MRKRTKTHTVPFIFLLFLFQKSQQKEGKEIEMDCY